MLKPLLSITAVLIVIFVGYSSGRYLSYAVDGLLQIETLTAFILIKMVIALEVLQTKGGFAYLPYPLVQALIENGELFEIDTPLQIKRPIYLVYRKNNPQEKLITEFKALFSKLQ